MYTIIEGGQVLCYADIIPLQLWVDDEGRMWYMNHTKRPGLVKDEWLEAWNLVPSIQRQIERLPRFSLVYGKMCERNNGCVEIGNG